MEKVFRVLKRHKLNFRNIKNNLLNKKLINKYKLYIKIFIPLIYLFINTNKNNNIFTYLVKKKIDNYKFHNI